MRLTVLICLILFFIGPSGSCKTALVHAVASLCGFKVIELNASHWRSGSIVKKMVSEAAQSQRLPSSKMASEFDGNNGLNQVDLGCGGGSCNSSIDANDQSSTNMTMILFDEVDVVFADDINFHNTIIQLAKTSKCPLVLTANHHRVDCKHSSVKVGQNSFHKLMTNLRMQLEKSPKTIQIKHPCFDLLGDFLHRICMRNVTNHSLGSTIRRDCMDLALISGGDIKAAVCTLNLLGFDATTALRTVKEYNFQWWLLSQGHLRNGEGVKSRIGISLSLEMQAQQALSSAIVTEHNTADSDVKSSPQTMTNSSFHKVSSLDLNLDAVDSMMRMVCSSKDTEGTLLKLYPFVSEANCSHADNCYQLFSPIVTDVEPRFLSLVLNDNDSSTDGAKILKDSKASVYDVSANEVGALKTIRVYGKNFLQRGCRRDNADCCDVPLAPVRVHTNCGLSFPATVVSDTEIRVDIPVTTLTCCVRNGIRRSQIQCTKFHDLLEKFFKDDMTRLTDKNGVELAPESKIISFSVSISPEKNIFHNILMSDDTSFDSRCSASKGQSWLIVQDFRAAQEVAMFNSIERFSSHNRISSPATDSSDFESDVNVKNSSTVLRNRSRICLDDSESDDFEVPGIEYVAFSSDIGEEKDELLKTKDNEVDIRENDKQGEEKDNTSATLPKISESIVSQNDKEEVVYGSELPPSAVLVECLCDIVQSTDFVGVMGATLRKMKEVKYIDPFVSPVDLTEFSDYLTVLNGVDKDVLISEELQPICEKIYQHLPPNVDEKYLQQDIECVLPLHPIDMSTVGARLDDGSYGAHFDHEEIRRVVRALTEDAFVSLECLCINYIYIQYLSCAKCLLYSFIKDMNSIWINCIIYNGIDSDFGKVAKKHHASFFKALDASLFEEYNSGKNKEVMKCVSNNLERIPKQFDETLTGQQRGCMVNIMKDDSIVVPLPPPPSWTELSTMLLAAESSRQGDSGAICEFGGRTIVTPSRSIIVSPKPNLNCVDNNIDDLDKLFNVLDFASVSDLCMGVCDRQHNAFDFDLDKSFEIPTMSSNGAQAGGKDSDGLGYYEKSIPDHNGDSISNNFNDADIMDICASKEGSLLSHNETKSLRQVSFSLVNDAARIFKCAQSVRLLPSFDLETPKEQAGRRIENATLALAPALQDRIRFLNELLSSNVTKLFRHSTSSCGCQHTLCHRLTLDVIPYLLVILDGSDNGNLDKSNADVKNVTVNSDCDDTDTNLNECVEQTSESTVAPRRSSRFGASRCSDSSFYHSRKRSRDVLYGYDDVRINMANSLVCNVDMIEKLVKLHTLRVS